MDCCGKCPPPSCFWHPTPPHTSPAPCCPLAVATRADGEPLCAAARRGRGAYRHPDTCLSFSKERAVIVCSCNVLSDGQVRSAIASAAPRPKLSHVYASLGCAAKCGRCACTIKVMLEELRRFVTPDSIAIEAANFSLNDR